MYDTIPLFKSHYSIGKSILTLEDKNDEENEPDSIIQIAKDNKLKKVFLVEDCFSGFLQAYKHLKVINIDLIFGIKFVFCDNHLNKNEEELKKHHKIIVFANGDEGYKTLIKLWTKANTEGFYYTPRLDMNILKENFSDNIKLALPFYDNFIFNNALKGYQCLPFIENFKPSVFIEDNSLIFDPLVKKKMTDYAKLNNLDLFKTKSIYYKSKKDFKSFLTFRCINNRTTLNKPEMEHMSSNEFCFESWMEQNKK
jgi:DNA polymerase-3 subunit alpha